MSTLAAYAASTPGKKALIREVARMARDPAFRAKAAAGAKGAYRAYRRYKKRPPKNHANFSTSNIGHPPSSVCLQATTTDEGPTNKSTRTLYQQGLLDIQQGTSPTQRLRDVAYVSGVKICMELANLVGIPQYVNIAVIAPRDNAGGVETADFFRAEGSVTTSRSVNFSTGLSANEFHCLPINTDRYTILKHVRHVLSPNDAVVPGYSTQTRDSYRNVNWWIPIKRQFRWDVAGASNPESGAIFLVYWFDGFQKSSGEPALVNHVKVSTRTIVSFKDPGMRVKYTGITDYN